MPINYSEIQLKLNEFLIKYSMDYPIEDYPVDVFGLAERAGYTVLRFFPNKDKELPKISGALVYDKKRIFINGDEALNRQRFTCAHELGHAVLHEKSMVDEKIAYRVDGDSSAKESQANYFAACLVMPERYLRELYAALPKDMAIPARIEALARHFQVSTQAMLYRLENLRLIKQNDRCEESSYC